MPGHPDWKVDPVVENQPQALSVLAGRGRAWRRPPISDERFEATRVTAEDPLPEEPEGLEHSGGNKLSDLPPGCSLLITSIERDDQGREYVQLRWEHGFTPDPPTSHGAFNLPLPEPDATALNVRLWWTQSSSLSGRSPNVKCCGPSRRISTSKFSAVASGYSAAKSSLASANRALIVSMSGRLGNQCWIVYRQRSSPSLASAT